MPKVISMFSSKYIVALHLYSQNVILVQGCGIGGPPAVAELEVP